MEHTLARQAASIERVVSTNAANITRAVEELANRSATGSDALSSQARVLKEVSATLVNQLGGLTKRFEDQGTALISASRTFEMSNSKVDSMMEARQAGFTKLMETVTARAADLDRMMNSYSNMLEQSLSQAELRARKVTELLAKDSAEKSQVAIWEIERLRQDAQAHTQKAVTELQANFTSLSDQVSGQLSMLSSKFTDTTRAVRDTTRRAAVDLESAQNELQRHAKVLPETAKQSASAMRRALQDQLSALDALSELSHRHTYASAVSAPEQKSEPVRRDREGAARARDAPGSAGPRSTSRSRRRWRSPHGPSSRRSSSPGPLSLNLRKRLPPPSRRPSRRASFRSDATSGRLAICWLELPRTTRPSTTRMSPTGFRRPRSLMRQGERAHPLRRKTRAWTSPCPISRPASMSAA